MDWKKIGSTIAGFAPTLGTLLGGPVGRVAGELVSDVLGVDNKPEAVIEALKADPSAVLKLKEAEIAHATRIAELQHEELKLNIDSDVKHRKIDTIDIQDARSRDKELKLAGHHNYRADIMLSLAFIALCFVIFMLFKYRDDIPSDILAIMNMSVGMLLKMISDGFQFEFGSSRGSKEKTIQTQTNR